MNPLVWAEIIRQWSTIHPEFAYLPRKFKIAISGSTKDRAATLVHDIGLVALKDDAGHIGFRVIVGGGLGRTPIVGTVIREFLPVATPDHVPRSRAARLQPPSAVEITNTKRASRFSLKNRRPRSSPNGSKPNSKRCKTARTLLSQSEVDLIAARFTQPVYRKTCQQTTPAPSPSPPRMTTSRVGSAAMCTHIVSTATPLSRCRQTRSARRRVTSLLMN